ncbi:MAG: deoxyribodipyrimidine photo-lyase, partial [Pseudomonadota bacterium]
MSNVVWFRQDLRLADNPALVHAAAKGPVIGLYVLDDTAPPDGRPLGGAARWWLHQSLQELRSALGGLVLLRGDPRELVPEFARRVNADGVYWNRRYDPESIACDTAVKALLKEDGLPAESFNGSLLFEPWQIKTQTGGPYKVFTAFWRACLRETMQQAVPAPPFQIANVADAGQALEDWDLLPTKHNWASGFEAAWQPGETGAQQRLQAFLDAGLSGYQTLRDRPDKANVSRLSPHLRFGEVSPRQVWAAAMHHGLEHPDRQGDVDKFVAEIGWREFSYHLLYHFPELPRRNLNPAFDAYP